MKKSNDTIMMIILAACLAVTSPLMLSEVLRKSEPVEAEPVPEVTEPVLEGEEETETETAAELTPDQIAFEEEFGAGFGEEDVAEQTVTIGPGEPSYFDDALFIGDTRMREFSKQGGPKNADYYFSTGYSAAIAAGDANLAKKLSGRDYRKVYVMLGINDSDGESFKNGITQLTEIIRAAQPDACVILLANLHVSGAAALEDPSRNNDVLTKRNASMEALADGETVFYLDVNPEVTDESGDLPTTYTDNGILPNAACSEKINSFLLENTITIPRQTSGVSGLTFSKAIKALKNGMHIARKSWGEDQWLEMSSSDPKTRTMLLIVNGEPQNWTAGQDDLLADDWRILQ